MTISVLLEACVDTLESALAAERGGADRVELCGDLGDGGTTPSHGTLALVLERLSIPVFPIIRPRGGGFVYSEDEVVVMRADLAHARDLGAPGAVIGGLTGEGDIDLELTRMLRADAPAMQLTFHRAFDLCRDATAALETLITLGIDRVLTSGQCQTAAEGADLIATLVARSTGRIVVMAGGGIDTSNVEALIATTEVREVHVRGTTLQRDAGSAHQLPLRKPLPDDQLTRAVTSAERVRSIRSRIAR